MLRSAYHMPALPVLFNSTPKVTREVGALVVEVRKREAISR